LDQPYMQIGFATMIKKRAGWLCALFLSEMLTASAMQSFQSELEKALVLTLFIPLIMSSGGNSGSQATSLVIRAIALREVRLRDWWRIAAREIPAGLTLGLILGVIGIVRITLWQEIGLFDYGTYWPLVAATVGATLVGIVTFGSLTGSMLPFALKRLGFDPASASAPFVATLVDVTGLVIYFSVAYVILKGTLL
jgi:magnesium transporter